MTLRIVLQQRRRIQFASSSTPWVSLVEWFLCCECWNFLCPWNCLQKSEIKEEFHFQHEMKNPFLKDAIFLPSLRHHGDDEIYCFGNEDIKRIKKYANIAIKIGLKSTHRAASVPCVTGHVTRFLHASCLWWGLCVCLVACCASVN